MIRLRQVALVAADLEAAEAELGPILGEPVIFRDPGVGEFGLHNGLFAVGDRFVEIVSPTESGTTAGRLLERRGGDGGYMVILQTDDLDLTRKRADDLDIRLVFEARAPGVVGLHFHPRDVGAAILSIDQTDDWNAWPWASTDWVDRPRTSAITDLVGVELQADDPEAIAQRWSAFLGLPAVDGVITLDDGSTISVVVAADGRGDGVGAILLRTDDSSLVRHTVESVGTRIRYV